MMPGQENKVMDNYQKNPAAVTSLRGTVYEEKIIKIKKEKKPAVKASKPKSKVKKVSKK